MKTHKKRSQFVVRELRSETEFHACLELDHSFSTEYVWQMDMREENEELLVRFRTVRLPRAMQVTYPRDRDKLVIARSQCDGFLIAVIDDIVLGYVNMRTADEKVWVYDLVVGTPFRRRKIGSALLEQATRWAHLRGINNLTLEIQTKNHPGITFAQKHGFVFCGFNDDYYPNQDIAVFFSKSL
jgi:GNAT superfamily N-acetyltransferase